ncbi:hypothetical protein PoB_001014400 [Plakobranchus ocellatus]|uniref:Uncharacterized protein n=1 Tax=Plakobranchus ocellatus TaxID=259542 RepID=A0AAV3YKU1_9GAST|nr:hypothetical protein PoB_001014400 [Plakobranchus ocellatus]
MILTLDAQQLACTCCFLHVADGGGNMHSLSLAPSSLPTRTCYSYCRRWLICGSARVWWHHWEWNIWDTSSLSFVIPSVCLLRLGPLGYTYPWHMPDLTPSREVNPSLLLSEDSSGLWSAVSFRVSDYRSAHGSD